MPMSYRPPIPVKERILTFGGAGVGKSNGLLSIARLCKSDDFYVVDTDLDSYERLLWTDYTDVAERGNVHTYSVGEWSDIQPIMEQIKEKVRPNDWFAFDLVTATWDWVQDFFIQQVHGREADEYFIEVRQEKQRIKDESKDKKGQPKSLGALEGWMDWPVINKIYRPFQTRLLNMPCHVYLASELAAISEDDDREIKNLFGPYAVKPKGQKRMGHIPHTVLMMKKNRRGEYTVTTIKDRGRGEFEDEAIGIDFAREYLVQRAGWKATKIE